MAGTLALSTTGCMEYQSVGAEMNYEHLPDKLPAAVARQRGNIVKFVVGAGTKYEQYGSGVRIGHSRYLTAGHVFYNEDRKPITHACSYANTVHTPTRGPVNRDAYGHGLLGTELSIQKAAVFYSGDTSNGYDAALVRSGDALPGMLPDASPAPIARSKAYEGEALYFENFQPYGDEDREPEYPETAKSEWAAVKKLAKPAIYGGNVVKVADKITVDTSKSYGRLHSTRIKRGASGGAVFDRRGKLVGISVAVEVPGGNAIVQPVTPRLLGKLRYKLAHTSLCAVNSK